jgi:hypothetical protein
VSAFDLEPSLRRGKSHGIVDVIEAKAIGNIVGCDPTTGSLMRCRFLGSDKESARLPIGLLILRHCRPRFIRVRSERLSGVERFCNVDTVTSYHQTRQLSGLDRQEQPHVIHRFRPIVPHLPTLGTNVPRFDLSRIGLHHLRRLTGPATHPVIKLRVFQHDGRLWYCATFGAVTVVTTAKLVTVAAVASAHIIDAPGASGSAFA